MRTEHRVVIAHDYVSQRGGAERTVLGLLEAFPGSRLITSVYDADNTFPEFRQHDIETLWLNRVPSFRRDPRLAFPLLARAWQRHVVMDADVVIASSSGWAHGVGTSGAKIVYCHNTARWLYQPEDYLAGASASRRLAQRALAGRLRRWDQRQAQGADHYVVNSRVVGARVLTHYGRDSLVIPPPVMLDPDGPQEPVVGLEPGFLLTVARERGYKNVELVCDAVDGMPDRRLAVIGGLADNRWSERVRPLGRVSDAQLRWLYANCAALVSASHEDFGLTPLEANLFGRPSVLLRAGGFVETLVDGMTGRFIESETVEAVQAAISSLPQIDPNVLRTYGEGFRAHVFAQRMRDIVDTVLGVVPAGSDQVPAPRASASYV